MAAVGVKRSRTELESGGSEPSAALSVEAAFARVAKHVGSGVPGSQKLGKAFGVAEKLAEQVTDENVCELLPSLVGMCRDAVRLHSAEAGLRGQYHALFARIQAAVTEEATARLPLLRGLLLAAVHHNALYTDDAFQFEAAAGAIERVLASLPCSPAGGGAATAAAAVPGGSSLEPLLAAVADALFVLQGMHPRHPWARSSVERVFAAAAKRRLLFPAPLRSALDAWNNRLQALVRQQSAVGGGLGRGGTGGGPLGSGSSLSFTRVAPGGASALAPLSAAGGSAAKALAAAGAGGGVGGSLRPSGGAGAGAGASAGQAGHPAGPGEWFFAPQRYLPQQSHQTPQPPQQQQQQQQQAEPAADAAAPATEGVSAAPATIDGTGTAAGEGAASEFSSGAADASGAGAGASSAAAPAGPLPGAAAAGSSEPAAAVRSAAGE